MKSFPLLQREFISLQVLCSKLAIMPLLLTVQTDEDFQRADLQAPFTLLICAAFFSGLRQQCFKWLSSAEDTVFLGSACCQRYARDVQARQKDKGSRGGRGPKKGAVVT